MFRKILPLSVLLLASCGYIETTSTQRSYVEDRDACRARADATPIPPTVKGRDADRFIIGEFAKCMQPLGWAVATPEGGKKPPKEEDPPVETARAPATVKVVTPPPVVVMMPPEKLRARRTEQCRYARHAKNNSSIAKDMAKDCDRECKANRASPACAR